jgi:5,5'-dehydrodivanillate O-demethylase
MTASAAAQNAAQEKISVNDIVHTGPGTLAGRYLRRSWQPVYQVADLPIGWSIPLKILGENLTLFRGSSGKFYLVGNRCAHRGTQLSTGLVDGEGIRCAYHGWKYDGEGRCIEQPSEPRPMSRPLKIAGYACQEYLGLVFAYMGEGEPPELPRFPHFEGEGVVVSHRIVWPFNYFQHLENAIDEVHIGFLHAVSPYQGGINNEVPIISTEPTDFGLVQYGARSNGVRRATYYFMPNLTSWSQPPNFPGENSWRDMLGYRVPIDDHSHVTYTVTHANIPNDQREAFLSHRKNEWDELAKLRPVEDISEDVLDGRMRFQDIPFRGSGADMTRIQDRIIMMGQGSIVAREYENLGEADTAIVLLRKIWIDELQALRDGRPTKQWARTMPAPTSGL